MTNEEFDKIVAEAEAQPTAEVATPIVEDEIVEETPVEAVEEIVEEAPVEEIVEEGEPADEALVEDIIEAEAEAEAGDTEAVEEKVEEIIATYTEEEINSALNDLTQKGIVGHLVSKLLSGEDAEQYTPTSEDVQAIVTAVEAQDSDALATAIMDLVEKASAYPTVGIVEGYIKAENGRKDKEALANLLKSIELNGDIGYTFNGVDDFSTPEFQSSKYGKILGDLNKKGINTISQLEMVKPQLIEMLNEGIVTKGDKDKVSAKIAPTAIPVAKIQETTIIGDDPDAIGEAMKKALAKGDTKEYSALRKQLMEVIG